MRLLFPALVASILLLSAASAPPHRSAAEAVTADTLRLSVRSGDPLVTLIPGTGDETFRALRAPALSWLVGRSFYWKTLAGERGREFVLIERRARGEVRDTLVLVIDVEPG